MKSYITYNISRHCLGMAAAALALTAFTACDDDEIDNTYSRNLSVIQMMPSADYIVLDESRPDDVALTVEWNAAINYGNDYITTYQYELSAAGSTAVAIKEYEDDGVFRREYTNRELQEMLVDRFGRLTSTPSTLNLQVTATFEGPRTIVPDIATAAVKVKTYGAKQYLADKMSLGGTAVGDKAIELTPAKNNPQLFTWNGQLAEGSVNFPIVYFDENNALSPAQADTPVTGDEMPAVIVDAADAYCWLIPAAGNYKVTVDLANRTVKIVEAGAEIDIDRLYMVGTAAGNDSIEIARTLENEQLYAWRGELKAGRIHMPVMYDNATAMSIVPKAADDHDIHDGQAHDFTVMPAQSASSSYWEIPEDGTYRIVVDLESRSARIYSSATDPKNKSVSYNNTVDKINPYTQEVTELWMWGGFNASAHDDGMKAGFQTKYKLTQSLASPYVFVYHGEALPRSTSTDDWSKATGIGALNFLVSNIENNVYAFGSTADAKRNSKRGYLPVTLGEEMKLVAGQSDNRYAYFCVPENCNFVVVDIENLTVTFDNK